MDNERPPIAAAVVVEGGRVLLVRRRVSEGALSWQFPAGAVEPGESPSAAAVRETREETGLEVEAVAVIGERVHPATGRWMHYIACKAVRGTAAVVDAEELDAFAWSDRTELEARIPAGLFGPVAQHLHTVLDPPAR